MTGLDFVVGYGVDDVGMRTSELAGQAGVNPETLRYYERRGLLGTPPRTAGGYRDYPDDAVRLLGFIKRAQQLGFTLDDVDELLHLDRGGPEGCDAARALAETRKADLEARIADLGRMRDSLADLIATCDLPRRDRNCALLAAIENQPPLPAEPMMIVNLEVLHVPDCPNLAAMLTRLRQLTDLPVATREITTETDASAAGMSGSPTLLINGHDPFRSPNQPDSAIACRIYRDEHGQPTPAPSTGQLRDAIAAGATVPTAQPPTPGEMLSSCRTRTLPPDPTDRAVYQAVLRSFATTGHAPPAAELTILATGSGRTHTEILAALHHLDAIRLGTDGQVSVAYPFSARPTRHRVRINNQVDVHAMCAIDALGVAPMLERDTRIESTDTTSGQPVTVTSTAGHTSWDPPEAVVFLGAAAGGGPSADSCCDYLNFFTDEAAAKTWTDAHPHVPGQVLAQDEAEALARRLFGTLLHNNAP